MIRLLLFFLLSSSAIAQAQTPRMVKAPVLKNRAEIVAERERIAQRLLKRGDSLLIRVAVYVDEFGNTHQPEVKQPSSNPRADTAAMLLTKKMKWIPAQNARRGVMMTIPVKLVKK
jgi:hypothetical protein